MAKPALTRKVILVRWARPALKAQGVQGIPGAQGEEWLIPSGSSVELSFSDIDIARARLIRELQVDLA
jgi:hypothetical protein